MVSFRFHIVSLIAVFLALALGIGMGVTVIDKATVDLLQRRLDSVRNEVNDANQRSDNLDNQLKRTSQYEERAEEYLVHQRLTGKSVLVVAVKGTDGGPLGDLKEAITAAGGNVQGTLWLTDKALLENPRDVQTVADELGLSGSDAAQVRQALLTRINAVLAGASESAALQPLVEEGFLDWEGDRGGNDVTKVAMSGAQLLFASGGTTLPANEKLALPLLKLLAAQPAKRVVAVESGRDADGHGSAQRAIFLGPVRGDSSLNDKLSTVDNIEVSSGRVATVLALSQLEAGRTGDYGYGGSTDGAIPKLAP